MPNHPLRRSKRIAAKAKKEEKVDDGDETKHGIKQSDIATSSASRRRSSRSRSRSRSQKTKRRCSLQCLDENVPPTRQSPRRAKSQQKTTTKKKRCKASLKSKKTTETTSHDSAYDGTLQSAVKSNQDTTLVATVTPNAVVVKSKDVKFNLGRNSIAQYVKDDPPNIVEHLTDEVVAVSEELFPVVDSDDQDDETTRRNEEILAEWETNFDDLDTCQVSRRAVRRVSMSS